MAEKLNFSLPEKKSKGPARGVLTVLLLLVLVVLAGANLLAVLSGPELTSPRAAQGLSAKQVKTLATKLAQRNLYAQAAAVWQGYLATGDMAEEERARTLFQVGTLLENAERYGEAIEYYYRSEMAAALGELGPQINAHVKQCFEKLGKFAALRYELMDRTSMDPSQTAGGKVVAEIGAEKITEAQLDALIEASIENQLAPMAAFMTSDQLNEQKKRLLEQSRSAQGRQEFLQGWLAQEILYRQALDADLAAKPAVRQMLEDVTRGVLSQQLMNEQLASRINITETDLQTYYTANRDKYVEPARARISHIRVGDEQKAGELLKRIEDGGEFAELAKEFSEDESTRDEGGKVQRDVVKGSDVPGIGDANDLNERIFAVGAATVLEEPFETGQGWEIVKVDETFPKRQRGFDEVRQQVMMELLRQKRQDVQRDYLDQMMDKYNVIVHTSVFTGADPNAPGQAPTTK